MRDRSGETWLILGASSAIARAFARKLAAQGACLLLAGRDIEDLATTAADCRLRGAALAEALHFDVRAPDSFGPVLERLKAPGTIPNAALFTGSMPPQAAIDAAPELLDGLVADNFTGPARFLHTLAPLLEERGAGTIVGVSSVAGDRGRLGNYAYGAAKAGFSTYLSGLRNRLGRAGAHVITVKPGPVDTAMTWGLEGLPRPAPPEAVADDILTAIRRRRSVIYTPFYWRYIMMVIRALPEAVFRRMSV
ncbi:MAG: SDR family NAD(P)-dependent oxidoreductase [Tropicimonas sp.]|uniref:SDR family NAD(P)-dependent oxidoreductase n=1 Tax=Tropicimonas sp. TaxID=2067044 RepID=UPI003A8744DE